MQLQKNTERESALEKEIRQLHTNIQAAVRQSQANSDPTPKILPLEEEVVVEPDDYFSFYDKTKRPSKRIKSTAPESVESLSAKWKDLVSSSKRRDFLMDKTETKRQTLRQNHALAHPDDAFFL